MLTPEKAWARLAEHGLQQPGRGMDDPTEASYPFRWWIDHDGVLCFAPWRGPTTRFTEFRVGHP